VDILEALKFLSLNQQVVRATAMAAWNPVGGCMFGNDNQTVTRPTRATAAGEVRVPTRGMDTLMTHALKTWNACTELRDSRTKAEAIKATTNLTRNSLL
jgi:hypothetical protein